MKTATSKPNFVDPSYKMRYQGLIADLDGFGGYVKFRGCTFTNNVVKYSTCAAASFMDTSTNSFTDNYSSFGTKSVMQVKSLISLANHWYGTRIMGCVFSGNSGTKGLIFVEFMPVY